MEWRIFFPLYSELEGQAVDVWSLLDVGEMLRRFKLHTEKRNDVYISCTASVGLKIRGQRELFEIKVRRQKYPCGTEEWNKLLHSSLHVDRDIPQTFRRELEQIQKYSLDAGSAQAVDEALSVPWTNTSVCVSKHVTKGTIHGVSVEQSDLKLSGGEASYTHSEWRTICFESHSLHKVQEMLRREVKGSKLEDYLRAVPDSVVQGYPAFIMGFPSRVA